MLLAAIIGSYTLIGGLGATFYVSYFNTGFIFILILLLIVEVSINSKILDLDGNVLACLASSSLTKKKTFL
jgi:Na+/proline symporter